jgi:hypothetical protein
MHRRTKGLTEFNFNKEDAGDKDSDAELFSTVCISGWLKDSRDFQRPVRLALDYSSSESGDSFLQLLLIRFTVILFTVGRFAITP